MALFFIENNVAHRIIKEEIGETEANTEGNVFITACGVKKPAWHYGAVAPYKLFQSSYIRQVPADTGASLCQKCVKQQP